jgi:aarF domain-containing kinase
MLPKYQQSIQIPKPYHRYCSKHLLVMEYLDGIKLVDGIRRKLTDVARLQGKSVDELMEEMKVQVKEGKFQIKTIQESKEEQRKLEQLLWYKDITNPINIQRFVYNWSILGWLYGPVSYERTEAPLNLAHIIEILCEIHGNQIFEHGIFNGDPHPGNILLLSDGRLGLIDYGQIKTMTISQRINYARMILAHSRGDKQEIIRLHFDVLGTQTKYRNEEVGYLMSCFYNDRDTVDITQGKNIASFIDYLESQDPMIRVPEDYIFASRVSIMLRGMGKAFGLKLRMSQFWEQEARLFLQSQQEPEVDPAALSTKTISLTISPSPDMSASSQHVSSTRLDPYSELKTVSAVSN